MRRGRTPKYRLVDSPELPDFLPRHKITGAIEDREFRVVYKDSGALFQRVRTNELIALAEQQLIWGVIDKHNYLLRVVLIASVHAAWRVIRGLRRPVMPSLFISKRKQTRGAKHWIARPDRAASGMMGSVIQMQLRYPDFSNRRKKRKTEELAA